MVDRFYVLLIKYNIFFGIVVSLVLLSAFFHGASEAGTENNSSGFSSFYQSLSYDYNFGVVPILFGIIGILYGLSKGVSSGYRIAGNIFLLIQTITIFFSGSRRGIIALIFLLLILALINLFGLFRKSSLYYKAKTASSSYLVNILIIVIIIISFVFLIPTRIKTNTLQALGIPKETYLNFVSIKFHKYASLFSRTDYNTFKKSLWRYDSKDPESGWNQRIGSLVTNLTGKNVEIVPANVIGYKMGRGCDASSWNNNAYSYTDVTKLFDRDSHKSFHDSTLLQASVYCYVSEDFDGTWVRISAEGKEIGDVINEYDLKKKGTWQKLTIKFENVSVLPSVFLYWAKYGVTDFDSLNGYVIFAYPEYGFYKIKQMVKEYNFVNPDNVLNDASMSFFSNYCRLLITFQDDKDPIRNFAAKIISEDTVYSELKNPITIDSLNSSFISLRLVRWKFAIQIFLNEYTLTQKVIGGGFNFLNWYGNYFLHDKKQSDWPHNPFLSILLYSGMIGLLYYCLLLQRVTVIYIRNFKKYLLLGIFFVITLFFSFFSGGNPFDPPIMGFFFILPFFLDQLNKDQVNK